MNFGCPMNNTELNQTFSVHVLTVKIYCHSCDGHKYRHMRKGTDTHTHIPKIRLKSRCRKKKMVFGQIAANATQQAAHSKSTKNTNYLAAELELHHYFIRHTNVIRLIFSFLLLHALKICSIGELKTVNHMKRDCVLLFVFTYFFD